MIILWLLKLSITMLIHSKDDLQFVTEFPCFLGHPVLRIKFQVTLHATVPKVTLFTTEPLKA